MDSEDECSSEDDLRATDGQGVRDRLNSSTAVNDPVDWPFEVSGRCPEDTNVQQMLSKETKNLVSLSTGASNKSQRISSHQIKQENPASYLMGSSIHYAMAHRNLTENLPKQGNPPQSSACLSTSCESNLCKWTDDSTQQKMHAGSLESPNSHIMEQGNLSEKHNQLASNAHLPPMTSNPNQREQRTLGSNFTKENNVVENLLGESSECEREPWKSKGNPTKMEFPAGGSTDYCTPCEIKPRTHMETGNPARCLEGSTTPCLEDPRNLTDNFTGQRITAESSVDLSTFCVMKLKGKLPQQASIGSSSGSPATCKGEPRNNTKEGNHAESIFCKDCGKSFSCKTDLCIHQLTHTGEKPIVCSVCGKGFTVKERMKAHQKVHHRAHNHKRKKKKYKDGLLRPIKCNICAQTFKYNDNLKEHGCIQSGDQCFRCLECRKVFSCDKLLKRHLKKHTSEFEMQHTGDHLSCTECKRNFQWKTSLILHQCSVRVERPFKCTNCGQSFITQSNLQAHKHMHNREKCYSCEECGQGFKRRVSLMKHEMMHTGHKPYECSRCGKGFCQMYVLKTHEKVHNSLGVEELEQTALLGEAVFTETTSKKSILESAELLNSKRLKEDNKAFKCTKCGRGFAHESKWLVHERIHTDEKDFGCTECGKCFKSNRGLRRHMDSHIGEHICNECGKTFSSKCYLVKHSRMHTGEMPHKCPDCGKTFKWEDGFENHKRTHTGEKPYKCVLCDKRFTSTSALSMHRKLHVQEKTLKCPECERTFSHSYELESHRVVHMGEKQFSCEECGKGFRSKRDLTFHWKIHSFKGPCMFPECGQIFQDPIAMKQHQKIHKRKGLFKCSVCEKSFNEKRSLNRHEKIHSADKSFSCTVCGKSFMHKNNLSLHEKIHSGDKPFTCPVCGKSFAHKGSLTSHQLSHSGDRPFSCPVCKKSFLHKRSLNKHQKSHSGIRPFSCPDCGKSFLHKTSLSKHQKIHSGERPYSCTVCGKTFIHKDSLSVHQNIHSGDRPFPCTVCGKSFIYKSSLTMHQSIHSDNRPFSCTVCKKSFIYKKSLIMHQSIHSGDRPFSCSVCKKSFFNKNSLSVHQKIHSGDKPYSCPVCKKSFFYKHSLSMHESIHSGNRPFSCVECGKTFFHQSILSMHQKIHSGERTFSCPICKKSFFYKHTLTMHQKIHSGDRPFSCLECGKKFFHKSVLSMHQKIHSGDRTFSCPVCPKNFIYKSSLNVHQKVHSGERPFSCPICKKSFFYKHTLTMHQKIHSGDRPFSCAICAKSFIYKSSLSSHQKIHSSDKPFSCTVCAKSFAHKKSLSMHQIIHSGDKPFSCPVCAKSFNHKSSLSSHQKIHSGDKPFSCTVCAKSFAHKKSLSMHQIFHSGDKPFSCSVCAKSFKYKSSLSSHQKIHSGDKPFSCTVCAKSFVHKISLSMHQKIHSGDKPFSCPVCAKSFAHKKSLSMHQTTHTGDKPFSCPVCAKSFPHKRSLSMHQKIHTGDKPFSCPVCAKSFAHKKSLSMHQNVHSGDKPFSCPVCAKSFAHKKSLSIHQKIHSAENSFKCPKCNEAFQCLLRLNRHLKSHASSRPPSLTQRKQGLQKVSSSRDHHASSLNSFVASQGKVIEKMLIKGVKCGEKFDQEKILKDHLKTHGACKCNVSPNHPQESFSEPCGIFCDKRSYWCADCGMGFIDKKCFSKHQKAWHMKPKLCRQCGETFNTMFDFKKHSMTHISDRICADTPSPIVPSVTTRAASKRAASKHDRTSSTISEPTISEHATIELEDTLPTVPKIGARILECLTAANIPAVTRPAVKDLIDKISTLTKPANSLQKNLTAITTLTDTMPTGTKQVVGTFVASNTIMRSVATPISSTSLPGISATPTTVICVKCGRNFENMSILLDHLKTHEAIKCKDSEVLYQDTTSQTRGVSCEERSFWCVDCWMGFMNESQFSRHRKAWHIKKPRPCSQCGETFSTKFDLEKHRTTHTTNRLGAEKPAAFKCAASNPSASTLATPISHVILPATTISAEKLAADQSPAATLLTNPDVKCPVVTMAETVSATSVVVPAAVTCVTCGDLFHQMSSFVQHLETHVKCKDNESGTRQQENSTQPCGMSAPNVPAAYASAAASPTVPLSHVIISAADICTATNKAISEQAARNQPEAPPCAAKFPVSAIADGEFRKLDDTLPTPALPDGETLTTTSNPSTVTHCRNDADQQAVLVLSWRIQPAETPQSHEGGGAPARNST